ncbi:MAG: HAMP domain-containing sensor histidine kinase [Romboutsia sp.]
MINIIFKEKLFKRIFFVTILITIITYGLFTNFQYNNLKNIYLEKNEINKNIIGSIVSKYPDLEVDVIKSIYTAKDQNIELGQEIIEKYGYDNYSMKNDINFKQHLSYFLVNNLIVFLILLTLMISILHIVIKYLFNKLSKVNLDIENIISNKYIQEEDFKEEGIFNRIYSELNKLSKSLNLKFSDLNKEKESIKELVTDISHQLKTPLASLKLYNSLLIEEDLDEKEQLEFLSTNEKSIDKLHNLIDSLVNISRLEANMINIKKEDKSIKETLIKAINSSKVKANFKKIAIIEDIDKFSDMKIPHDSKWTEESIFNIIDNAIKYTNEGGNIDISISETINFVRIDVLDNGIGIEKCEFNDIFKRFYRNEKVEEIEGSGVGLYLSRKILELQGGNIIVSSKIGQGSKFSLFLTKM